MPADPPIRLGNANGILEGTPQFPGSYVIAVCIEEYRNGVLLTKTRRDFEFNVVNCSENLVALVQSDTYLPTNNITNDSIAYFESCNELDFSFINLSVDQQFIQDYLWQFEDQNGTIVAENSGATLRDYSLTFPEAGLYTGRMILNDGATCFDRTDRSQYRS